MLVNVTFSEKGFWRPHRYVSYTRFFISNTFISNVRLKLTKNQRNTLRLNFCYLKIVYPSHSCYHPKLIWDILKKCAKSKCACFNEIIWLTIMKIRVKMNNRSHRYYMTITRLRHGCNYTKYKKCLSIMMVICNKQHLSHNWNQQWGWVEKSVTYIKKSCIFENSLTHR